MPSTQLSQAAWINGGRSLRPPQYANLPANELTNAAVEQQKITELRMRKSFGSSEAGATHPGDRRAGRLLAQLAPPPAAAGSPAPGPPLRSPITTHVLDTCMGRPAPGVKATLARLAPGSAAAWQPLAAGQTDKDGRIGNLLAPSGTVEPGHYKMTWDTAEYMHRCSRQFPDFFPPGRRFYPSVSVEFEIHAGQEREHFHVPLTWNPFGYSTYRGS
ncbi:hypothetical protein D9Q98_004996 [Chlorella vulgaris]|uniref:hydroxyisourate hydrolase n=1 Tax=Chlorella vulgaris TaxID=3077 RepID=A0A9D4TNL7_CHLVU|nr:hypothetical protein D9Q98_004996 [Chlorella vulgaris]